LPAVAADIGLDAANAAARCAIVDSRVWRGELPVKTLEPEPLAEEHRMPCAADEERRRQLRGSGIEAGLPEQGGELA
jgi:hypothetical protein